MNNTCAQTLPAGFDLQGHRGCRGLMPENTIPAMLKAIELGVTTLEMDAVITRDSQVVVSHEPFFNHEISTRPDSSEIPEGEDLDFNIYQMDYSDVRKFDVGMRPHPRFPDQQKLPVYKPLLGELIDSVEQYILRNHVPPVQYNIETKCLPQFDQTFHPGPGQFVELLMAVIRDKGIAARTTIQSFDRRTLQYLHQHYPDMQTTLLVEEDDARTPDELLKNLGFLPSVYSPHYSLVTPELIKACHQQNIRVIPWTVNDAETMRKLVDLGVDGLITDYPDRIGKR